MAGALGPTANKQGKIAGANAIGAEERFAGIVGTAVFKVFDIELARTGLGLDEAEHLGLEAFESITKHRTRGHYPGGGDIHTSLVVERGTGRLLGAQIAADEGAAGRINVFATALSAGFTVDQIATLDLAYAPPPSAPVYDPVLVAATSALKELVNA